MITARMVDHLVRIDYMVFIHRVFLTLNPGIPFASNWHLDAIADALAHIHDGRETRLVIAVPPRCGKSIMTSIGFAAWRLGHDPWRRIICVFQRGQPRTRSRGVLPCCCRERMVSDCVPSVSDRARG